MLDTYTKLVKDSCIEDIANQDGATPLDCKELVAIVRQKGKNHHQLEVTLTSKVHGS